MPTLEKVSMALIEVLCLHEAFRRVGYPPEDLFVFLDPTPEGEHVIGVHASWGEKQLHVAAQPLPPELTPETFSSAWASAVEAWNKVPRTEAAAYWEASAIKQHSMQFVPTLTNHGMMRMRRRT